MSLTLKEVRNPVPRVRAEKVLAALLAGGDFNEYNAAGAIAPTDSIAMIDGTVDAQAMTLADGTIPGEAIRLQLRSLAAGVNSVVITPTTFADGTTLTFDAEDEYAVLIWVTTNGWTQRVGNGTIA